MKDCTTCKYGYEDERLGIPMCHHPKRFSEDCVNFNMYEEKEIETEQSGSSEIPNDLDKSARKSAVAPFNFELDEEHLYEYPYLPIAEQKFKEGAEWMAGQGVSMIITDETEWAEVDKFVHCNCDGASIIQIRKKD